MSTNKEQDFKRPGKSWDAALELKRALDNSSRSGMEMEFLYSFLEDLDPDQQNISEKVSSSIAHANREWDL